MTQRYFATTTLGLEDVLQREIREIRGRKVTALSGGVEFDATQRVFYAANYLLHTTNRIYLRVDEFRARDFPELFNKTKRFEWERLLHASDAIDVHAASHGSRLVHTGRIADTVAQAIAAHFEDVATPKAAAKAGKTNAPPLRVNARLHDNRCTLSLDASGELLHKRGWRESPVRAPLRETTAAALLQIAGWQPSEPLFDPMCGSGTFVIEAARMAMNLAPGALREFAFHRWANFRAELWDEVVAEANARVVSDVAPIFFGADINLSAVEAARANAAQAGVDTVVSIAQGDASQMLPPTVSGKDGNQPGLVICNPPYGARLERTDDDQAADVALVDRFATQFPGWRLALLLPATVTPSHPALTFRQAARFRNGGIAVRFWLANPPS